MQLELKQLNREVGATFVYVTHDQEEALTMSDRIAIMDRGRIAQMGPPREVYERPGSAFVAKFLGEANLIRVRREGAAWTGAGGAEFKTAAPDGRLSEGQVFVRPEKVSLLTEGEPSAENHVEGVVQHTAFLGNVVRYEVMLADGQIVLSDTANSSGMMLRAPGDTVQLGWRAADALLLEA
jgi:ABC-type Fe3+/spermidine/putrescine transport system ATPase subunit